MVETMSSAGAGTLRRLLPWFAAAAVVLRAGFLLFPRPAVAFAAIAAVRPSPGLALLLGFGGSVAGLVASKPQEAPQGPLWAAFAVLLFAASRPPIRRAALGLALALTAFSVYCYRQTPQYL